MLYFVFGNLGKYLGNFCKTQNFSSSIYSWLKCKSIAWTCKTKISREIWILWIINSFCFFFFFFNQNLSAIPSKRTNTSIACMAANYMIAADYIHCCSQWVSSYIYIYICVENVYYTNYNQYLGKLFVYARFYSWWKLNNVQYDIEDKGLRCAYLRSELIALRNKMYFNATSVSTVNSYTFNFGINILIFIINGIPLYAR